MSDALRANMNLRYSVNTSSNPDAILSEVTCEGPGFDTSTIIRQIVSMQDQGVRAALIRLGWSPPSALSAQPVQEPMTERDHWDFAKWHARLAELADAYYETGRTAPAWQRARAELLLHATDCATGWRARSEAARLQQVQEPAHTAKEGCSIVSDHRTAFSELLRVCEEVYPYVECDIQAGERGYTKWFREAIDKARATQAPSEGADAREVMSYAARNSSIRVERCRQKDGPDLWAVRDSFGECLGSDGWEYEPQPSNRDAAFLVRCRFDTVDDAFAAIAAEAGDRSEGEA